MSDWCSIALNAPVTAKAMVPKRSKIWISTASDKFGSGIETGCISLSQVIKWWWFWLLQMNLPCISLYIINEELFCAIILYIEIGLWSAMR